MAGQPAPVQSAFETAYTSKVKSRRKSTALSAGLTGTSIFFLIYTNANK